MAIWISWTFLMAYSKASRKALAGKQLVLLYHLGQNDKWLKKKKIVLEVLSVRGRTRN
jgi:hypothetical protein